jgi:hypothetical protein
VPVHTFRAELWEHSPDEPGSWHFLTLPVELADDLRLEAPREGFGSIPVEARTGATRWRTSLFPDSRTGSLLLPVKKAVREAEGLAAGDFVDVALRTGPGRSGDP